MKRWIPILGVLGTLFFAGCATTEKAAPEVPVTYRYQAPTSAEGKVCLSKCEATRSACQQNCVADQSSCLNKAQNRANFLYQEYVSQCQLENVPVEKNVSAFLDDTQCKLQACECDKDYRACFQLCGGKLIPQRQ
jgi:hypothetical protein